MADTQSLGLIASALATAVGASAAADLLSGKRAVLDRAIRRLLGRPVPDDPESDRVVVRIGGTEVLADLKSVIKEQTLEGRLARISELMAESSRLSDQISAELEARAATAKKLQQEADDAAQLAAINREQAEAVRRLLEADISEKLTDSGKAIERNVRRDAIRIGAASFVAGGGLTLLITLLVHPLG